MTSSYHYSPLRSSRSIRLLILEASADENSVLKARVQDVSLDSPPLYEAISYVWGVTDSTSCPASSVIQLEDDNSVGNTGSINISPNCSAVLKRLRQRDEPKTLWIDAVSIDQDNIVEKSTQIPLMGEVYSKAYRALIWLGEPQSVEAEGVFNALPELSKVPYQEPNSISDSDAGRYQAGRSISEHIATNILSLPYFKRTWTLQEIAFSSNLTEVVFGGNRMLVETFFETIMQFAILREGDSRFRGVLSHMAINAQVQALLQIEKDGLRFHEVQKTMSEIMSNVMGFKNRARGYRGLFTILDSSRLQETTKPLDKVYSVYNVLDLFRPGALPRPDYSRTTADVFTETAKGLILDQTDDSGLHLLRRSPSGDRSPDLPSWVPDFQDAKFEHWPTGASVEYAYPDDAKFQVTDSPANGLLVSGKALGRVVALATPQAGGGPQKDVFKQTEEQPLWDPTMLQRWAEVILSIDNSRIPLAELGQFLQTEVAVRSTIPKGEITQPLDRRIWPKQLFDANSPVANMFSYSVEGWVKARPEHVDPQAWDMLARSLVFAYEVNRPTIRLADQAFFSLTSGLFGFGIDDIREGDVAVVFPTLDAPAILREQEGGYRLIGFVYICGAMGEDIWSENWLEPGSFTIL